MQVPIGSFERILIGEIGCVDDQRIAFPMSSVEIVFADSKENALENPKQYVPGSLRGTSSLPLVVLPLEYTRRA